MLRRAPLIPIAVGILLLAACDSGPSYGSNTLTNFTPKPQASPSPSPPPVVANSSAPTRSQPPQPQPTRTVPPPPQTVVTVTIRPDEAGPPSFDPATISIARGSAVKWVNQDSVARTLEADDGSFTSPSISPGGFWLHTFSDPGKHSYHDKRPYAIGEVTVR